MTRTPVTRGTSPPRRRSRTPGRSTTTRSPTTTGCRTSTRRSAARRWSGCRRWSRPSASWPSATCDAFSDFPWAPASIASRRAREATTGSTRWSSTANTPASATGCSRRCTANGIHARPLWTPMHLLADVPRLPAFARCRSPKTCTRAASTCRAARSWPPASKRREQELMARVWSSSRSTARRRGGNIWRRELISPTSPC